MEANAQVRSDSRTLLERIDGPDDLRRLDVGKLPTVADELRQFLIREVARSGGHFAAGLGTVELAVALHYVFDTPRDALVWDVGHQAYPHKVLTGRREQFASIRRRGGLSGFLRRDESPYDAFGAGHSSTSISAALGMAVAGGRNGSDGRCVAIIGDGGLTAGLAYEALNHAGAIGADLLVVLNDNGMSISRNVGALSTAQRGTQDLQHFFERLGFDYTGPVDGHDTQALVTQLGALRAERGPRVLHVLTTKGRGYAAAEADPVRYHGVTPFDPASGLPAAGSKRSVAYTDVFGDWLCEMAERDPRLVAVTPAMREGSGLVRFAERFPDRYFDVGIAEQHCVTFAAGLACRGLKPVVAIYSTFLQRALDQVIHDVALQGLPVLFAIDRAGLVGPDGMTHAGNYDLSYLRCLPGMTVMAPANGDELRDMLYTGFRQDGPVAVRYPRTAATALATRPLMSELPLGVADLVRAGSGVAFLNFGTLLDTGLGVAETLDATMVNMRFVKPLDTRLVLEMARRHQLLVTLEENATAGGAGSAVTECLAAHGVTTPVLQLGLPDRHIEHGTREELLHEAGLDRTGLLVAVADRLVGSRNADAPVPRYRPFRAMAQALSTPP